MKKLVSASSLFIGAGIFLITGLLLGFLWAPVDSSSMGFSQKIFYFYVPVAEASFLVFGVAAFFAIRFLMTRRKDYDTKSRIAMEVTLLFVILTMIVLVAAFGIASTLFMMVMKKTREIAILKSMGATRQSIMRIFMMNGLVIGGLGTGMGLILGLTLCGLLKRYEFIHLPKDVYPISTLPVQIQTLDVLSIVLAAMAISFLATLYPAWQAARLDPVVAIRYE